MYFETFNETGNKILRWFKTFSSKLNCYTRHSIGFILLDERHTHILLSLNTIEAN